MNLKEDKDKILEMLMSKDLLDNYTRSLSEIYPFIPKPSLHLAKNLIEVIIEYNESKRK